MAQIWRSLGSEGEGRQGLPLAFAHPVSSRLPVPLCRCGSGRSPRGV